MYCDIENLGTADRYLDEIHELASDIPLFDDLTQQEVELLCRHLDCYGAPRNYPLLKDASERNFLLLILTGWVEVRHTCPEKNFGHRTEIMTGGTIGELSLIDGLPDVPDCITSVPTDFAVLTQEGLNRLLENAPRVGNKVLLALLKQMSRRMRGAHHVAGTSRLH